MENGHEIEHKIIENGLIELTLVFELKSDIIHSSI